MKKIVSFDLDGTLVNAGFGDAVWNHGIPDEYSRQHSIPFEEAKNLIIEQYQAIGDAKIEWYTIEYWLKKFGLAVSPETLLKRYESHIAPLPGAIEVLQALRGRYMLVIASNAARIFVEKELTYTNLSHYFTHIISATTDYKMVKKGDAFYRELCERLNVSPLEIIHVGDHPVFDFEAPSRLGIESYHLNHQFGAVGVEKTGGGNGKVITDLRDLLDRI